MTNTPPGPYVPDTYPVSVKGVVFDHEGRVLLLRNERNEWELPGGKLEGAEALTTRVEREVLEESGWTVTATTPLNNWVYEPLPGRLVLIVTYGCIPADTSRPPQVSHEHKEAGLFHPHEVPALTMPQGYKDSVAAWHEQLRTQG